MIIPALDLICGNIVRLYQGSYHKQFNYTNSPISYIKEYISQGAQMIHLIDLSGARDPTQRQISLINQLIQQTLPLSNIQIGGGIRNATDIDTLLKIGATRVILGSIAITNPKIVKKWFKYFDPNNLVLAIDVRIYSKKDRRIVIHGWEKETPIQLEQILEEYQTVGLKHVLCTDISKDGTLLGSNKSLYQSICHDWPEILFQSSGGICELSEIPKLRHSGINSIIIGRAFLEKKFTVSEAISCWQNESSHVLM